MTNIIQDMVFFIFFRSSSNNLSKTASPLVIASSDPIKPVPDLSLWALRRQLSLILSRQATVQTPPTRHSGTNVNSRFGKYSSEEW